MTQEDLKRWEGELKPLLPVEAATPFARRDALALNAEMDDVKAALLEPVQRLLEKGSPVDHLADCLERTVAQVAFWRRVLLRVHGDSLRQAEASPEYLVSYLLS